MSPVPEIRVTRCNDVPVNPKGDFVLYWMTAFRRTRWNFSLQKAVKWANDLTKPLLVFEALRVGYPWACDRFHRFVIDGIADNSESLKKLGVSYYPYLEPAPDADKGLLAALAEKACLVITDDFPSFFLPRICFRFSTGFDLFSKSMGLLYLRRKFGNAWMKINSCSMQVNLMEPSAAMICIQPGFYRLVNRA